MLTKRAVPLLVIDEYLKASSKPCALSFVEFMFMARKARATIKNLGILILLSITMAFIIIDASRFLFQYLIRPNTTGGLCLCLSQNLNNKQQPQSLLFVVIIYR
jgi:hypothetical protein